jgi:hypothetical protein
VRFKVEIPIDVLDSYPDEVRDRAIEVCEPLGGDVDVTDLFDRHVVVAEGDAPPAVVTVLAAFAQGHPVGPLLDAIAGQAS